MKRLVLFSGVVIFLMSACMQQFNYPVTKKGNQTDEYFGTQVADPYRWLENDTSAETEAWVKAENELTFSVLNDIPFRPELRNRLEKIWDYPKYSAPFSKKEYYFFFKNDGMQNQSVLYIQKGLDGEPSMLLDPNKLSEDGTVALSGLSISNDAKYMAYSIARGGSDWNEIFVLDIESKELAADHIEWVKFSGMSWYRNGFYYSRYDAPSEGKELSNKNEFHKVYYHTLGEDQSKDRLIYEDKEHPQRNFYAQVTEDERFLIIGEMESSHGNALYVKDLAKKKAPFIQLAEGFEKEYGVVDNDGDMLYLMTNDDAPMKKLMKVDISKPEKKDWTVVIPEKEMVLEGVYFIGGRLIAKYTEDAYSKAYTFDVDGKQLGEVSFPGIGSVGGFSGEKNRNTAFFAFTSFTYPTTIFEYDVAANASKIFRKPEVDFNGQAFETSQVFFESKDGTKVPMFIVHKKGIELNGQNPCLLYGYGGFNISLTPSFSITRLPFLENGGVYVMVNLRGGGEYGEEWHLAGTKMQKQNVFDDFIAAAQYMIDNKYTNPEKIAINGGSNGGLLVGAVMTQRPDLFKVALPAVGVMDMLRYHNFTIGWAWAGDYGRSDDSKEMFDYLYGYSPLHNLKDGVDYPATLITSADHDDRVVPAHSFKFAARLQEANGGNNPVLIRIETKAGHGAGKPTSKIIDEAADVWGFTMYYLGMKPSF